MKSVKAFFDVKGVKCNLQACYVNERSRHRTFRIGQKEKVSVKSKVPGEWVQGSTELAKIFMLQTTWL